MRFLRSGVIASALSLVVLSPALPASAAAVPTASPGTVAHPAANSMRSAVGSHRRSGVHLTLTDFQVHGPTAAAPVPFPCNDYHPPASDCGFVLASVEVSGLQRYGGLPACSSSCDYDGGLVGSSLQLRATLRCEATGAVHQLTRTVPLTAIFGPTNSAGLNDETRLSDDSALLTVGGALPITSDPAWCPAAANGYPGAIDLMTGYVSLVKLRFRSTTFPQTVLLRLRRVAVPVS